MRSKKIAWVILIVLAVGIKIFSFFPNAVEKYYATGIYPVLAGVQRIAFGWIPFSVGDVLYAVTIIYLAYKLVQMIRKIIRKQASKQYWWLTLRKLVFVMLVIYVCFNGLWALNYNRQGIAQQLGLQVTSYSKEDLLVVMDEVMMRMEQLDSQARVNRAQLASKKHLFREADNAYRQLAVQENALKYHFRSVKPSLFSYIGNYLGYTGYYNPFTGEAQVNTTVPLFIQPFTTCHEMGHQLGYAKENEANFAGYLSAKSSADPAFRYSVYFDLYTYSRFYLFMLDSALAKQYDQRLPVSVKADYREMREFSKRYRNPVETIIDKLYGQYLKANQQPSGKLAYSEVIAWLVAYYKKYGKEAV